jgi:hypothetical protein
VLGYLRAAEASPALVAAVESLYRFIARSETSGVTAADLLVRSISLSLSLRNPTNQPTNLPVSLSIACFGGGWWWLVVVHRSTAGRRGCAPRTRKRPCATSSTLRTWSRWPPTNNGNDNDNDTSAAGGRAKRVVY